jgi:hypothetical protein
MNNNNKIFFPKSYSLKCKIITENQMLMDYFVVQYYSSLVQVLLNLILMIQLHHNVQQFELAGYILLLDKSVEPVDLILVFVLIDYDQSLVSNLKLELLVLSENLLMVFVRLVQLLLHVQIHFVRLLNVFVHHVHVVHHLHLVHVVLI